MNVRMGFNLDIEGAPEQETLRIQVNALHDPWKPVRNQDLNIVQVLTLIALSVLPTEVGVDRHLRASPSTNGRDVIQGHCPAPIPHQCLRLC